MPVKTISFQQVEEFFGVPARHIIAGSVRSHPSSEGNIIEFDRYALDENGMMIPSRGGVGYITLTDIVMIRGEE